MGTISLYIQQVNYYQHRYESKCTLTTEMDEEQYLRTILDFFNTQEDSMRRSSEIYNHLFYFFLGYFSSTFLTLRQQS
jgi:hypothetical protein